jgi:hypothetical protein
MYRDARQKRKYYIYGRWQVNISSQNGVQSIGKKYVLMAFDNPRGLRSCTDYNKNPSAEGMLFYAGSVLGSPIDYSKSAKTRTRQQRKQ